MEIGMRMEMFFCKIRFLGTTRKLFSSEQEQDLLLKLFHSIPEEDYKTEEWLMDDESEDGCTFFHLEYKEHKLICLPIYAESRNTLIFIIDAPGLATDPIATEMYRILNYRNN